MKRRCVPNLRRQGVAATRVKSQSGKMGAANPNAMGHRGVFTPTRDHDVGGHSPWCQAFEIVGNGHEKPSMQKLILDIKANIEGGSTLHESLAKFPL